MSDEIKSLDALKSAVAGEALAANVEIEGAETAPVYVVKRDDLAVHMQRVNVKMR